MPRQAPSGDQLPLQQAVVDQRRLLTVPWVGFLQRLYDLASSKLYVEGTHAQRVGASPPTLENPGTPAGQPGSKNGPGTFFYETDRGVLYQSRLVIDPATPDDPPVPAWVYVSGTMRNTLANKPTDLGWKPTNKTVDTGFLFYATDYAHTWRWTGTTWEFAPGDRFSGEIAWFALPLGTGWALCDGSPTTMTTPTATTVAVNTPNLIGAYAKGATGYTGTVIPASGSLAGGTTDAESGHTHAIDHDHPSFQSSGSAVDSTFSGGPYEGVSPAHKHNIDVPAYAGTSGAGSAHTHTIGSMPVTAEPKHVDLMPYLRR